MLLIIMSGKDLVGDRGKTLRKMVKVLSVIEGKLYVKWQRSCR